MSADAFHTKLERSVSEWVERKVIPKKSGDAILAFERSRETEGDASKLVPFLATIGAVFVGLGFILYFAANWDTMSNFFKLAVLSVATFAVTLAAFFCLYVREMPKTGQALALLGSILYGASIFLVGQAYNLGGTVPGAILLWIAGIVPIAYVSALKPYPFLLSVLLLAWTVAELENSGTTERAMIWIPFALGFLLSGFARWHSSPYADFSKAYARIGLFFVFSWIFLFTFKDVPYYFDTASYGAVLLFGMMAAGVLAYAADVVRKRAFVTAEDGTALAAVVFVLLSGTFFAVLPDDSSSTLSSRTDFETPFAVFSNLFFVAFAIGSIAAGLSKRSPFAINVSLFFLAAFILTKYFDWFFDMMDRALFFIFGGALLMFGGWFVERRRRNLVRSLERSE